jgi:hypothetical protein
MPVKSSDAIARKNAKKRAARRAVRSGSVASVPASLSKTDPTYRRRMPPVPDMDLPSERRDFLRQAVLNTPGARA